MMRPNAKFFYSIPLPRPGINARAQKDSKRNGSVFPFSAENADKAFAGMEKSASLLWKEISYSLLNRDLNAALELFAVGSNHSAKPVQPALKRIDQVADYRLVGRLFVEKVLQVRILIRRLNGDSDAAFDLAGTCAGLRAQLLVELC